MVTMSKGILYCIRLSADIYGLDHKGGISLSRCELTFMAAHIVSFIYAFKDQKARKSFIFTFEPRHEKTCFMAYANNKDADRSAHLWSLISIFVVCCLNSIIPILPISKIVKTVANFCSWAGRFVSYLVGNPEDRFSRNVAHVFGSFASPVFRWELFHDFIITLSACTCSLLYPRHLCRGVYSFCLSIRMFVRSYFRPVRGITSKFYGQATRVEYISPTTHQKAFIFRP